MKPFVYKLKDTDIYLQINAYLGSINLTNDIGEASVSKSVSKVFDGRFNDEEDSTCKMTVEDPEMAKELLKAGYEVIPLKNGVARCIVNKDDIEKLKVEDLSKGNEKLNVHNVKIKGIDLYVTEMKGSVYCGLTDDKKKANAYFTDESDVIGRIEADTDPFGHALPKYRLDGINVRISKTAKNMKGIVNYFMADPDGMKLAKKFKAEDMPEYIGLHIPVKFLEREKA